MPTPRDPGPLDARPDDPLTDALRAGYRRFRSDRFAAEQDRWRLLAERGQRPETMVIACSDSRSAPETVFDAGPGELFVVRNVAALVPPYEPDTRSHAASAALEFAVRVLEVSSIVVMGHGRCGGIRAAVEGSSGIAGSDFIDAWVAGVRALAREVDAGESPDPGAFLRAVEHRSVMRSLEHLGTFPWIEERVSSGTLRLYGTWFDIALGELHALTPDGWERLPDA